MALRASRDFEAFCNRVVSRLGYCVAEHNVEQVEEILRRRVRRTGSASAAHYLERCHDPRFCREEYREVAVECSVAETYFFRHPEQFQAAVEVALPERIRARRTKGQLRILSAGCASGEEAYSLAAAFRAALAAYDGWTVRVWGIDVNPRLVVKAAEARYSAWSLRAMPEAEPLLHFEAEGHHYVLEAPVRGLVEFEERNLLDPAPSFWQPGRFDIIFCRNVLIYFTPTAIGQAVRQLTGALAPGGFLFLGPSETLRGVTQEFHLRHTHGAFYYQRKPGGECPHDAPNAPVAVDAVRDALASPPEAAAGAALWPPEEDPPWMTAISHASGRIAALAEQTQKPPRRELAPVGSGRPEPSVAAAPLGHSLEPVHDLLQQERFTDALQQLLAVQAASDSTPDALLLTAVLLINTGEVAKAGDTCRRLLAIDELNTGAHYLMAVCDEQAGDFQAAVEHDERAIHLDPQFAMPRMHLGLMARRSGDLARARRALQEAVPLLAREHSSRILLFGGGFSRETLVQYCRSQLRRCGGSS